MTVNPTRALQVAVGAVGVYGGYRIGAAVVRNVFQDDLTGPRSRVIEDDGHWIVEQASDPQGPGIATVTVAAGAAAGFVGSGLAFGGAPATNSLASLMRLGGGAALGAAGVGLIGGSIAIRMLYNGTDSRPNDSA